MLISKVADEDGDNCEVCAPPVIDNSHEYQTASELFELMAKNQNFNTADVDTLTPGDLVLLYKNIDLGTKLMSSANEFKHIKPNQHVETVVYNDDPESDCSDLSDVYSSEDLESVYLINNERIDLLNNQPSLENTLCHKFGNFEIETSGNNDYNKHFIFKDPYIKEQLKNFNFLSSSNELDDTVLPASLLDYVCCKRLEDNYNFYMDNIIRYVKNTIEQLKRISNGDYLTDKAKEKWKEVEHVVETPHNNTKVLATSTSIPLHVECKVGGLKSMWDDIVHSAVDVRSLSKILEKKIVVEIPKLIKGSYTLLSKCCAENLIISCKKENKSIEECNKESRMDVVFQLKRSETGHVISNISSIMILQTAPIAPVINDSTPTDVPLPLMYKEINDNIQNGVQTELKITEVNGSPTENYESQEKCFDDNDSIKIRCHEVFSDSSECLPTDSRRNILRTLNESNDISVETIDNVQREAAFSGCPDNLRVTIQRLAIQSALPEETAEDVSQANTTKKRSPTRVRIKSPYENQSYIMEEKKRRKLLEIRERRERKKMALAETCKINKNKYIKGAAMPQASSSVTKLSITNKSFYNSIYGQNSNVDSKLTKNKIIKGVLKKDYVDSLENLGSDQETPKSEKNPKKFINRSYYLDDTVTEMMYMNLKQENDLGSVSTTSAKSSDFRSNLHILSQLISPCDFGLNGRGDDTEEKLSDKIDKEVLIEAVDNKSKQETPTEKILAPQSIANIAPLNTPNIQKTDNDNNDKNIVSSVECRKSIDKIYQLMKKMGKKEDSEPKKRLSVNISNKIDVITTGKTSSSIQGSDSGTSLKHHLTSSNPSTFSFDKANNGEVLNNGNKNSGNTRNPTNVIPKVIISSKPYAIPNPKVENKKEPLKRRVVSSPSNRVQENNPLKAISQLLHEFENVQKNRLKSATEQKAVKKLDTATTTDAKISTRQANLIQANRRRSRLEQHNDVSESLLRRVSPRLVTPRDKKMKPIPGVDVPKIPYQQVPDDRYVDKGNKKKITDMIDEAKEARGEAVRGPPKFTSRLNSLAQPKRSYVQAHSEEYQTRYGRNLITDRLQRLAAASPTPVDHRPSPPPPPNPRNKLKRSSPVAVSAVSLKLPHQSGPQIDRSFKARRSNNSSPEVREKLSPGVGPSYKQSNVPETPEILKKKMVAVESYVKNHYGRASSSGFLMESHMPHKSRVPLLPNDIDIASVSSSPSPRESTEAGSKLHSMIDSMIKTSHGLEVLTECLETNSRSSKEITDDLSLIENLLMCDEEISIDSDYTTGTTDEGIVLSTTDDRQHKNIEEKPFKKYDVQFKSATELEKAEHSLCRPLSMGTFTKRLRITNVTLTPKPSMQQLFLLQSGDTGSLIKASKSSNLTTEKLLDLKAMPVLSKSHLNWSFTNLPMQIATVGYAFPEYKSIQCGSLSLCRLLEEVSVSSVGKSPLICNSLVDKSSTIKEGFIDKANKDSQCYKGGQIQYRQDQHVAGTQSQTAPSSEPSCNKIVPGARNLNKDSKCIILNDVINDQKDDKTIHRTQTIILQEKNNDFVSSNPDGVDYTTSLDILMGLLNEIKKITTCQTHIANNDPQECKELEMILNKTALMENSVESSPYNELSMTSLENLRCLESSQSIYSFYLSDTDGLERCGAMNIKPEIWYETKNSSFQKPDCADKEVNVDLADKERINKLTDVPSVFFPITLNHSTNMTSSVYEELCPSSTQSLYSFTDHNSNHSNESTYSDAPSEKLIELPQMMNTKDSKTELSQITREKDSNLYVDCYEANLEVKKSNVTKLAKDGIIKKNVNIQDKCRLSGSDFDPIMKMKRDILVTIYSMLVLTVFAALTFPDVLYNE